MRNFHAALLFSLLPTLCWSAETNAGTKFPAEIKPFIERGTEVFSLDAADLNGDGLSDYVLVLEKKQGDGDEMEEGQRPFFILIRQANGTLKVAKRNDKIVLCSRCGGAFGDPFESIAVAAKTFTVSHYGGSSWRWANSYTFNYSRRDNTWQLVRADESTFNAADPEKTMKQKAYTPPKHYGKIDIADFDPQNYRGRGEK